MRCREIMRANYRTCRKEDTAAACAKIMKDGDAEFVPVTDPGGRVVGIVTGRDLAVSVLADRKPADTPAGEIMTTALVSCRPDEKVRVAEDRMMAHKKAQILVLDEKGAFLGAISLVDTGLVTRADPRAGEDPSETGGQG